MGLGPFMEYTDNNMKSGVLQLLRRNARVMKAFGDELPKLAKAGKGARLVFGLAILRMVYEEGLLWLLARLVFKVSTPAKILAKIMEIVLIPEEELAEVFAVDAL